MIIDTIPFYIKREELASLILKETDEDLLDRLTAYFQKIKREDLSANVNKDLTLDCCRMTTEELKAEILKSEKAFEEGLFISHEEMRKKHPR